MLGSVAIFVWGKRRFSWCLFAQEFFADLVDIAGAHGDQEVTGLAVFQKVVFDFIEGWEVFTGSSQFLLRRRCLPVLHGLPESVLRRIPGAELWYGCRYGAGRYTRSFCADSFWQRSVLL